MQFFWKHLHDNKGDENVSKLIWIVIAFVIGALLLSTISVAFRTDGAIGGWLDKSIESWFGEADGRDGSIGGGAGGGTGGGGGGSNEEDEQVNEINGAVLKYDGENHTTEEPNTSYTSLFENSSDNVFTTALYLTSNGTAANSENLINDFSTMTQRGLISNTKAVNTIVSQNVIVLQYKNGALAYVGLDKNEKLTIVSSDATILNDADVIFSATKCTGTNTDIALFEVDVSTESTINYYEEINNSSFTITPNPSTANIMATLKYTDGTEEEVIFKKCYYADGINMWTYLPDEVKNDYWYDAETDKGLIFAANAKVDANGNFVSSEGNSVFYVSPDDETVYEIDVENITSIEMLGATIADFGLYRYYQAFTGLSPSAGNISAKINYTNGSSEQKTFVYGGEEDGIGMWVMDVGFGFDYPLIFGHNVGMVYMTDEKGDSYWDLGYVEGGSGFMDSTDGDGATLWPTIKSIEMLNTVIPFEIGQNSKNFQTNEIKESLPVDTAIHMAVQLKDGTSSTLAFEYSGKENGIDKWKYYLTKDNYLVFAYNAKVENTGYGQGTIVASNGTSVFGPADVGYVSNSVLDFYNSIERIDFLGTTKMFKFTLKSLNPESFSGGDATYKYLVETTVNEMNLVFANNDKVAINFIKANPYKTNSSIFEYIYANNDGSMAVIINPDNLYSTDIEVSFASLEYDINDLQKIEVISDGETYTYKIYESKNTVPVHVAKAGTKSFVKFNNTYSEALIEVVENDNMEDYHEGHSGSSGNSYNDSPMYYKRDTLTRAILSNSTTSISRAAFRRCANLTSIFIPNSVTTIADSAFAECTSLTTIYGVAGSYAETFANANGYNFVAI